MAVEFWTLLRVYCHLPREPVSSNHLQHSLSLSRAVLFVLHVTIVFMVYFVNIVSVYEVFSCKLQAWGRRRHSNPWRRLCVCVYLCHMPSFPSVSMSVCGWETLRSWIPIYRVIEKSRNPFLTHVLFVKNKLHWNQKTKSNGFLSAGNAHRVQRCMHSPRLSSLNTEGRPERFLSCTLPVSRKRFTRRDTVDLFGTGESGNASLNSFWQVR
jgi:hypothetical protein